MTGQGPGPDHLINGSCFSTIGTFGYWAWSGSRPIGNPRDERRKAIAFNKTLGRIKTPFFLQVSRHLQPQTPKVNSSAYGSFNPHFPIYVSLFISSNFRSFRRLNASFLRFPSAPIDHVFASCLDRDS